jgi:hypothetical protein
MKVLDLEHVEAQFGLLIREKENHDNYALLRFEDLDKVIEYYNSFKDEFNSKSNGKKMENTEPTQDGIDNILDVRKKIVKTIELLDKKSKNSKNSEVKKK